MEPSMQMYRWNPSHFLPSSCNCRLPTKTRDASKHGPTCADTFLFPTATSFSSAAATRSQLITSCSTPYLATMQSMQGLTHPTLTDKSDMFMNFFVPCAKYCKADTLSFRMLFTCYLYVCLPRCTFFLSFFIIVILTMPEYSCCGRQLGYVSKQRAWEFVAAHLLHERKSKSHHHPIRFEYQ